MSIVVNVNGESINYPQTGDTNWGDEATDFAVQTSSALEKIGLSTGTTVDLPGTLDVTGNTTLDANLSVGGNASITGTTSLASNATIAGTLGISNGTASTPSIAPSGDTNTGIYSIGADKIGFAANGVRQGEFGSGYGGFTGNIIQVQSTTKTDTFSTTPTANTWIDITGLFVLITPKYSNSKIIVMYHVMMGETSSQLNHIRLVRDSTAISIGDTSGSRLRTTTSSFSSGAVNTISILSAFFLDNPSTANQITYKIQLLATDPSAVYINRNQRDDNASYEPRGTSSITVMELQQ